MIVQEVHVEGELSLREVQLASLEILKDIDTVCRREGIRYWLMYGTLIGAVRHKGFIPWDDDLDIAMPRRDYERFITCFSKEPEFGKYIAINPDLGKNRPFLITRVSNSKYKMIGEYGDEIEDLGAFVDVYPMDGAGSDRKSALKSKSDAYKLIMKYLRSGNFPSNNRDAGRLKRFAKGIRALLLGKPERYQKMLWSLCAARDFECSEYVSNLCWSPVPDRCVYQRCWFDETEYMVFEDMKAPVPKGYDALLKEDYGDYMQLPPEEERVGHHFYSIVLR